MRTQHDTTPPAWALAARPAPGRVRGSIAPTVVVIVARRRSTGTVGAAPFVMLAYVVGRGVAGVASGSEDVLFGVGVAASAMFATAALATAFTTRPAAVHVLPLFVRYRPQTVCQPRYRRVAVRVTGVWAPAELAVSVAKAHT